MPNAPEFGATGLERAEDSRRQFELEAIERGLAPISYKVLFIKNGEEFFEEFRCAALQRAAYMKTQFGLDLDNDSWALTSLDSNRRWQRPIGDATLQKRLTVKLAETRQAVNR